MNPRSLSLAHLAAIFMLAGTSLCGADVPNATPMDLGTLPGHAWSEGMAVNSSGQVAGYSVPSDGSSWVPFVWQNGIMTALPLPTGDSFARATSINDLGQIVGMSFHIVDSGFICQACLWTPTRKGWVLTTLGTPTIAGGSFSQAFPTKINNAGQVLVGLMLEGDTDYHYAAIWKNGTWTMIARSGGDPLQVSNMPFQMNDLGQVLLDVEDFTESELNNLWIWDNGTATEIKKFCNWACINNLGQVVGVRTELSAVSYYNFTYEISTGASTDMLASVSGYYLTRINDKGQVLVTYGEDFGVTELGITTWANVYDPGVMDPLGTVSAETLWFNAAGEVAGSASMAGTAFYASADAGVVSLADLVEDDTPVINGMNDSGMVVGTSGGHAVLWRAGITVGNVSAVRKGNTVTVSVQLTNSSSISTAHNVEVTDATLDAGTVTSGLPSVRVMNAGATKTVTIKFSSNTSSGLQTFTIAGNSSLGGFSQTFEVNVP